MRNTFNYFNKAFGNKINVLERDAEVGFVQFDHFKTDVAGEFKQRKYLFKKPSFWKSNYDIYREDNKQLIGEVVFHNWKKKAEIIFSSGEKFTMNTKNIWGTHWHIDDVNREVLDFEKTKNFWKSEGTITANINDNEKMGLLVILGIFINFLYDRRASGAAV